MRSFSYFTIGKLIEQLNTEGYKIDRNTFRKLMFKDQLFQMQKTSGGWHVCSGEDAKLIISLIKENYQLK